MGISHLIETYGYLAVFLLVGAESLGIPLPGETALILAGIFWLDLAFQHRRSAAGTGVPHRLCLAAVPAWSDRRTLLKPIAQQRRPACWHDHDQDEPDHGRG